MLQIKNACLIEKKYGTVLRIAKSSKMHTNQIPVCVKLQFKLNQTVTQMCALRKDISINLLLKRSPRSNLVKIA